MKLRLDVGSTLLVILAHIVCVCGCKKQQRSPETSTEATAVQKPSICEPHPSIEDRKLRELLPNRVSEHCIDPHGDARLLGSGLTESLEQDCRALLGERCEELLAHSLTELASVRYIDADGGPGFVAVHYFRFASVEAAYAYYTLSLLRDAHPRAARLKPLEIDLEGMLRDEGIVVFGGPRVIEATFADERLTRERRVEEAQRVLPSFALAFAARNRGEVELPVSVRRLPKEERVPFGVRFRLHDALVPGSGTGAVAYYERSNQRYRIYASDAGDEAAARDIERTLRQHPGYRRLKDMPFGAFELNVSDEDGFSRWLIGRHRDRIVGIGDDGFGLPASALQAERQARSLSRNEKVRLLRSVLSRSVR